MMLIIGSVAMLILSGIMLILTVELWLAFRAAVRAAAEVCPLEMLGWHHRGIGCDHDPAIIRQVYQARVLAREVQL